MEDERIVRWVRQAQNGSQEAFGALVQQFEGTVFATAMARLRHRCEAREVTQDVFVQALRKLCQLREPERFPAWLRQIAVRMSINKALRRPKESTFHWETVPHTQAERQTPLDHLLRSERSRQVWGGLERLRDLDRRTLIAFYVEGQTLKEMSDEFASPIGTIKRRLHTARNRLREELRGTIGA